MTTEREPNHLPLRAGAMLLLAVAVVFFGLGAHHLATSGDSDAPAPTTTASPTVAQRTTSAPTTTVDASSTRVCVVNAGSVSGLAGSVTQELKAKGYKTAEPANMSSSSLSENTIFYRSGDEAAAKQVATDLGGGYSVESRPSGSSLPQCTDGVLVIAITE
jgi:hypothetical protein